LSANENCTLGYHGVLSWIILNVGCKEYANEYWALGAIEFWAYWVGGFGGSQ
jgi:hypothetical protein